MEENKGGDAVDLWTLLASLGYVDFKHRTWSCADSPVPGVGRALRFTFDSRVKDSILASSAELRSAMQNDHRVCQELRLEPAAGAVLEMAEPAKGKQNIHHYNILTLGSSHLRQPAARNRHSEQPDKKQMAAFWAGVPSIRHPGSLPLPYAPYTTVASQLQIHREGTYLHRQNASQGVTVVEFCSSPHASNQPMLLCLSGEGRKAKSHPG
ncbi:hypothetical protein Y1Q_0010732 [Alligator mississippiensis]|uniref:Uncharacterized protein n=1 Tax=Alligator mississippiensis TaxID=8496 RepID=A0A151M6K2_ALLMI|nr:hypothetical protein Y1Q_0010732 [Alligator mississippiensis]